MSHQDIIQTLIEWIDEHIDQPLNIDVVAKNRDTRNGIYSGCSVPSPTKRWVITFASAGYCSPLRR